MEGARRAVKIIKNKFSFHKQAKVEIKVLEKLRGEDPDDTHSCGKISPLFCPFSPCFVAPAPEFLFFVCVCFTI